MALTLKTDPLSIVRIETSKVPSPIMAKLHAGSDNGAGSPGNHQSGPTVEEVD